jgi:predicted lipoprotein with Yx(FWY)xxD motif
MRTPPLLMLLLVAVVLSTAAVSPSATAGDRAASSRTLVKVAFNKKLGKPILVDGRGFTLYRYGADSRNKPQCFNDAQYHCSKAWPPLRTSGRPRAGQGVKPALLGTAKRSDGAAQVTYNGHPLYTDAGAAAFSLAADTKPGDVNGQAFLGVWFVISPSGKQITH